jgi:hypothetical protein
MKTGTVNVFCFVLAVGAFVLMAIEPRSLGGMVISAGWAAFNAAEFWHRV